jgi:tetratricopeptide (TPR) repeat protein
MAQGRFHEAEREFAAAVEAARALGDQDPRLALALGHLADAMSMQARYAAAIPLYQQALAIDEQALGPKHPDLATCLIRLATPYGRLNRNAAAEAAEERARKIDAKFDRMKNPSTPGSSRPDRHPLPASPGRLAILPLRLGLV